MAGIAGRNKPQLLEEIATLKARIKDLESAQTAASASGEISTASIPSKEAIRESEEGYRLLFDNAADPIFISDLEANLLAVNFPACTSLGYTHEELMSRNLSHVDAQDAYLQAPQRLAKLTKDGILLFETVQTRKNGSRIPVEVNARVIQWQGKPAVMSICRDISERKRAEAALRESQERLKAVFVSSPDGMFLTDLEEARLIEVNDAYAAILGYSRDELIGRETLELNLWADPADRQKIIAELRTNGRVSAIELNARKKNGDLIPVSLSAAAVMMEGSIKTVGTIRDISERKRAEEALRESQERFMTLFISSPDPMYLITPEESRFLDINDAFVSLFGYSKEEVVGRTSYELNIWVDIADRQKMLDALRKAGRFSGLDMNARKKNGEVIPIALSAASVMVDGNIRTVGTIRDISERRRAAAALIESEEKYRTLFENMAQGAFYQRADGTLEDCNPSVLNLFGVTREQFLSRNSMDTRWRVIREDGSELPGEEHPSMRCLSTGKPIREQIAGMYNPLRKEFVWLSINATPMFREGEAKPYKVFVTLHDITTQKKVEEALKSSEESLRVFIETAPVALAMFDREMRFISASKRFIIDTGLSDCEVRGRSHDDLIPDVPERYREAHRRGLAGEVVREDDDQVQLPDGSSAWFRWEIRPWHNSVGHVAGIILFSENITERRLAEKALRDRNSFIETILENAPIGFAVNRIQDGTTVFVGSKFEDIYGASRGSLWSVEEFFERVYPDAAFREQMRSRIMADIGSGDPARMRWDDIPITTASGQQRYVCSTNIPLFDQNLMVSTVQDVTDRHTAEAERTRLEEHLQHAQKMESVGRLAGGVAHDFNNMLGVILGHTELALEQTDQSQPIHDDLIEIQRAAQRSADLTRQLLAFARKQTVAPKILDLNQVVSGTTKMLQRLIGEDIKIEWSPGYRLWQVEVDPSQIDQILANLAVNARDAIRGVGTLSIETGNRSLDETYCAAHTGFKPGDYVLLAVSDTGIGMDEETLRHIFEPFFTTKEVGKGTGLGLATVYGVVKQNNGAIQVSSQPGKGTRFEVYLPRYVENANRVESESPRPANSDKNTVLLVEDEPAALRLTIRMLQQQDYTVLSAHSPLEAIRLAEEYPKDIHILMTDLTTQDMTGPELAKQLLGRYPELKCLFVSGWTTDAALREELASPPAYFLQKPFSLKELTEVLQRMQPLG